MADRDGPSQPSAAPQHAAVHWLPCAIKFDGVAPVDQYFQTECNDDGLQATFRGRLLRGRQLPLPEGYTGHVIGQQAPGSKPAASSTFSTVTYWNHEVQPSKVDTNSRALEWLRLSAQIHATVSQEEVEKQLEAIMAMGYNPQATAGL